MIRYVHHCPDDEESKSLAEFEKRSLRARVIKLWHQYVLGGRHTGGWAIFDKITPIEKVND